MKKSILLAIASILLLCAPVGAQGRSSATIRPPQPNYASYGSYSRQLTVYRNTQAKLDEDARRRYRKMREEIRRNLPRQETRVIVQRGTVVYTNGDALRLWRERRNRR